MQNPAPLGMLFACALSLAPVPALAQAVPIEQRLFPADAPPLGSSVDAEVYRRAASSVIHFPACTGVVIRGGYLLTARHCAEMWRYIDPFVFPVEGGAKITVYQTPLTLQAAPYDAAVYRVSGFTGVPAELRAEPLRQDESVFGVAYYQSKKIAFSGKIVDPNAARASFCRFTNEDGGHPSTWKLESSCPPLPAGQVNPRVERDPVLSDAPMAQGMSGGPLFDLQGRVVGIASNVLSENPSQSDPRNPGVYVKASNVLALLQGDAASPAPSAPAAPPAGLPAPRRGPDVHIPARVDFE